jgi:predicted  nucleic acid-binding Zn-ribbon protein
MEAATPLRPPNVRTAGERLVVDGLVVEDECAVRLVGEREQAGEDPARAVTDAIEIGARVLDREHAAANTEFVKTEFTDQARKVAEFFAKKVDDVFGPDGQQAKELEKLFSDGSSASVQNRVREMMADTLAKSREDLVRQFSSEGDRNPLAQFQASTVRELRIARESRERAEQALQDKLTQLQTELQALRDEKEKLEAVEAERERGTAKGRSFEEGVAEAVDAIALGQGDDAEPVGDQAGAGGKTGDVLVSIDASNGPCRGRIVFEAKDRRLSKPAALAELDRALEQRSADFAVLVVPTEEEVPAKLRMLREYNGDKLVVALGPDLDAELALDVGYRLARARVLMKRGDVEGIDAEAIRDSVDRAVQAMGDVRKVKGQLTSATTSIEAARSVVEEIEKRVRERLDEIDALASAGASGDQDQLELG